MSNDNWPMMRSSDGKVRVTLIKQPFSPTGTSIGPNTMANGGIQQILNELGAVTRVEEVPRFPQLMKAVFQSPPSIA